MRAKVKCQACTPESRSCSRCGGFKILLAKSKCSCGHEYWMRPIRGMTVFEGKEIETFDGVLLTVHLDRPWTCEHCE